MNIILFVFVFVFLLITQLVSGTIITKGIEIFDKNISNDITQTFKRQFNSQHCTSNDGPNCVYLEQNHQLIHNMLKTLNQTHYYPIIFTSLIDFSEYDDILRLNNDPIYYPLHKEYTTYLGEYELTFSSYLEIKQQQQQNKDIPSLEDKNTYDSLLNSLLSVSNKPKSSYAIIPLSKDMLTIEIFDDDEFYIKSMFVRCIKSKRNHKEKFSIYNYNEDMKVINKETFVIECDGQWQKVSASTIKFGKVIKMSSGFEIDNVMLAIKFVIDLNEIDNEDVKEDIQMGNDEYETYSLGISSEELMGEKRVVKMLEDKLMELLEGNENDDE